MSYELKDNSGSLFRNKKKEREAQPDYTGQAKLDGVEYWIAGWIHHGKSGQTFLSLAFNPKNAAAEKTDTKAKKYAAASGREDPLF